jgi:hypothetical protein
MTTKRCTPLAVVMIMSTSIALGANSSAELIPDRQSLRAVEAVAVLVICADQAKETGLKEEELQKDVGRRLQEAGIKIVPLSALGTVPGKPLLRIIIESHQPVGFEVVLYHLHVRFEQMVALARDPEIKVRATTWEIIQLTHATKDRLVEETQQNLQDLITHFITDYREANSNKLQPADTNKLRDTAAAKQAQGPVPRQAVAEYKYVASKNSRVFHTPDCRWAKKIKPENLVTYKSRDEAVQDGKRPCKWCKP